MNFENIHTHFISTDQGLRQQLRKTLARSLQSKINLTHAEYMQILDLNKVPEHPQVSISISHSHHLGGWAWVPRPQILGFDIEIKNRLNINNIARISSKEEISLAPSPATLWTAKEASYKSLFTFHQKEQSLFAFSDMKITQWKKSEILPFHQHLTSNAFKILSVYFCSAYIEFITSPLLGHIIETEDFYLAYFHKSPLQMESHKCAGY